MQSRSINLTFHGIGEPPRRLEPGEAAVWLGRDRLLSMLDAVAGRTDIHLTFDDGNSSDLEDALPALRSRALHATFFVVAGRLGDPAFLDPAGVQALAAAGMKIGCHGMRHCAWRGLDERRLREELQEAKSILEDIIDRPVTAAACPFGSYDRQVLRTLRRCGYQRVYTSDRGVSDWGEFVQPRNTVHAADGPELMGRIETSSSGLTAARARTRMAVKRWR